MTLRDNSHQFLLEVYRLSLECGNAPIDGLAAAAALFPNGESLVASKRAALEKCELRGWIKIESDRKNVRLTARGVDRARQELRSQTESGDQVANHVAMHVGQAEIAAGEAVGEPLVVEAE